MSAPTQPQAAPKALEPGSLTRSVLLCFAWFAATCLLFFAPLARFVRYALSNDNASHAILIPAICIWVLYLERERVFAAATPSVGFSLGIVLFCAGVSRCGSLFLLRFAAQ